MASIKRPLSGYMYFVKDNRADVKREYPTASFGDIGRILGHSWGNLSDNEKAPYEMLAKQDRQRYELEKMQYGKPGKVAKAKQMTVERRQRQPAYYSDEESDE